MDTNTEKSNSTYHFPSTEFVPNTLIHFLAVPLRPAELLQCHTGRKGRAGICRSPCTEGLFKGRFMEAAAQAFAGGQSCSWASSTCLTVAQVGIPIRTSPTCVIPLKSTTTTFPPAPQPARPQSQPSLFFYNPQGLSFSFPFDQILFQSIFGLEVRKPPLRAHPAPW